MPAELSVYRAWCPNPDLFAMVRALYRYQPGEDRATGQLLSEDGHVWPLTMAGAGPVLIDELAALLGVRFPIAVFQAYLNGAGCDWHADTPFDAQAVLSLGTSRTFGIRRADGTDTSMIRVDSGDLVVMPSGFQDEWQHSVPTEDVIGERISLVFRTVKRG